MEAYKKWVRRNKDYVNSLESLANGLTWFLPERFSSSEIGPEAVTAFFSIITDINEHIIDSTPTHIHTGSPKPSSFPYSLCISALKDLETLVEVVAAQYYGEDKKWNFIAITEASKVLVRLALLHNNGYKMLLHGGRTSNVEKIPDDSNFQHRNGGFTKLRGHHGHGYLQNYHGHNPWNLEGRAMSALSRFGDNARTVSNPTWLQRVQHQNAIMEPPNPVVEKPTLFSILSEKGLHGGLFVMGEGLFIIRPLVYVLLIRKCGIRSWKPWVLSLVVDFLAMGMISHVTGSWYNKKTKQFHLSASEKDELTRRKLSWALYLMRDPFFSKYTRRRLERTQEVLEPVPIIGLVVEKFVQLIIGAQTRYTYMSGS